MEPSTPDSRPVTLTASNPWSLTNAIVSCPLQAEIIIICLSSLDNRERENLCDTDNVVGTDFQDAIAANEKASKDSDLSEDVQITVGVSCYVKLMESAALRCAKRLRFEGTQWDRACAGGYLVTNIPPLQCLLRVLSISISHLRTHTAYPTTNSSPPQKFAF